MESLDQVRMETARIIPVTENAVIVRPRSRQPSVAVFIYQFLSNTEDSTVERVEKVAILAEWLRAETGDVFEDSYYNDRAQDLLDNLDHVPNPGPEKI
ncbi:MAG: hypothetical protein ACREBU_13145 [Nitrososphaera sp.]